MVLKALMFIFAQNLFPSFKLFSLSLFVYLVNVLVDWGDGLAAAGRLAALPAVLHLPQQLL